ncbi:MAG: DNA-directed DNA polymerase II small subunit [Candidatus Methanofastidiosia archaeon]
MEDKENCRATLSERFLENGMLLAEEAYVKFLEDGIDDTNIEDFILHLSQQGIFIVTKDVYGDYFYPRVIGANNSKNRSTDNEEKKKKPVRLSIGKKKILAREIDADIKILKDTVSRSDSEGSFEDFLSLFRDRYRRLSRIFKEHSDMRDFIPIKNAKTLELKSTAKIVGIVQEKRTTKNGNIMIELEDLSGQIRAIILARDERLLQRAKYIVRDEILGVYGSVGEDIIFVKNFEFPDIPIENEKRKAPHDINAVFTSDTHIGSKQFLEKSFLRFIKWLRLETGNEKQKEMASKVKYVVINGDVVDGVGIYPNQKEELDITDIYAQYKKTAELIEYFPDWIEIIISPGNHDATRSGNPQLPISKKFAYELYEMDNVHMVSNPSFFSLHNVKCLLYHGDSIFDFISQIPGFTHSDPLPPMIEMLRKRHLAPIYGFGTQIIPEPRDYLCIDDPPDIFQTGHTHVNGSGVYRGVTVINSGGWQAQTEYQRLRNISPTMSKVPIVNLQTHGLVVMDFGD